MNSNSSEDNSTTPQIDYLLANLTLANEIFVFYCVVVHLIYFVLIAFVEELRTKSLFLMNHSVFANLLFPALLLICQFFDPSTIEDQSTATIICTIFEIYWPFSIYTRMYAILLIAVHRYIAVFKMELFNRVNKSNAYLFGSVVFIWFLSLSLTLISKYAFSTTYSPPYCVNGFSIYFIGSLLYSLFYTLFAMILPSIAIVVLYVLISLRLKRTGERFNSQSSSGDSLHKIKEIRFANQFIIMCTVVVLSICGSIVTGLKGVIPNFYDLFYYWRPILRCYFLFFSSLIPILALCFNKFSRRVFRVCFIKIKRLSSAFA